MTDMKKWQSLNYWLQPQTLDSHLKTMTLRCIIFYCYFYVPNFLVVHDISFFHVSFFFQTNPLHITCWCLWSLGTSTGLNLIYFHCLSMPTNYLLKKLFIHVMHVGSNFKKIAKNVFTLIFQVFSFMVLLKSAYKSNRKFAFPWTLKIMVCKIHENLYLIHNINVFMNIWWTHE